MPYLQANLDSGQQTVLRSMSQQVNLGVQVSTVTLRILRLPPSLNGFLRMHWTARNRLRDDWIIAVFHACDGEFPCFDVPVTVSVTRHASRCMDWDNFAGGLKPVMDALVHLRILSDDSPAIVTALQLAQVIKVGGWYGLEIEIKPVAA